MGVGRTFGWMTKWGRLVRDDECRIEGHDSRCHRSQSYAKKRSHVIFQTGFNQYDILVSRALYIPPDEFDALCAIYEQNYAKRDSFSISFAH